MHRNKLRNFLLVVLSLVLMACVQTTSPSDANIEMALEMSPQSPVVGESELAITLTDADGTPITDARLEILGDMNHAGMVPVVRDLDAADENGVYRTPFEWTMGGDWSVTVVAILSDDTEVEQTFDMTVAMAEGEEMDHSEMDHSADGAEDEEMSHDHDAADAESHDDESHADDKSDEGMGHDHDTTDAESDEGGSMSHDHDTADSESDEGEGMGHDHDDESHADDKSDEDMNHDHDAAEGHEGESMEHNHDDAEAESDESSHMDHSGEMDAAAMGKMIDTSDLHDIDEAVRAGNMEPEYLTMLEEFIETLNNIDLPAEYKADVEAANRALADLTAAMEAEDMEAVQPLVAEMHDIAHDLKIRLGKAENYGHDDDHHEDEGEDSHSHD